ncbi:MAG: PKD domain-containing protein [bacterium]
MQQLAGWSATAFLVLSTLGCSSGAPSLVAGNVANLPPELHSSSDEMIAASFEMTIDSGPDRVIVLPARDTAMSTQGLHYDLDLNQFQTAASFEVLSVARDAAHNLTITFRHRHPLPAPRMWEPVSATNRCDLGYTGRLVILADRHPVAIPPTDVVLDPSLVVAPDGYVQAGDLLATPGAVNTYPYVLLADESEDNREGQSNGGDPRGNYNPSKGGWQLVNLGEEGTGWTGFDYMHAGQSIINTFTLDAGSLGDAPVQLRVALLVHYTSPRGNTLQSSRMPSDPTDVAAFAYRLPESALDCSQVVAPRQLTVSCVAGSSADLTIGVRDWDAHATESFDAALADEADVTAVRPGSAGVPAAQIWCPAFGNYAMTIAPTGDGTGLPDALLTYAGSLSNPLGNIAPGDYPALIEIIDPEDAGANGYRFGVDPVTLIPSASRALRVRTYQALTVSVIAASASPQVVEVTPWGTVARSGGRVTFHALATNSPTSYHWDFGGGATPNRLTGDSPTVTFHQSGTYVGTVSATNATGSSKPLEFVFTVE